MKTRIILSAICLCLLSLTTSAQQVKTLHQSNAIQDGLYVAPDGVIFTTCGGLVGLSSIGKYDPRDGSFEIVSNEMPGSIDISSADGNLLYVTNYDDNTLRSFNRSTRETKIIAKDLDGPAGVEIASDGSIYVTSFGAPPAYKGNSIWRITPQGEKVKVFTSEELFRPQGMGWIAENKLLVANSNNGKLFVFDTSKKDLNLFLETGLPHGNIAVGRGKIYMASNRGHRILEISMDGKLLNSYGSGNGPENKDGTISEARFANPLGLAFSPDESKLYVAQVRNGNLRVIEFDE